MLKFLGISLLSSSFMLLVPVESFAGWKDELKKAGKKVEQVGRAVSDPKGPDAQKVLGSDARNFLQNPHKEINKFCDSASNKFQGLSGTFQTISRALSSQPADCDEGSN
ncbi:hypothetical protein RI570_02680 [Brucella pseudogrignonensis]|uniref:hypothetical protein n=1 Tax=Brucella pseudogrignonensis TaxID=419475 RepID=UPI0028B31B6E|nr:hypothetical protein [Brucella pseudogrignonensis]MDT6939055.1 hypothetical protein [Brucella pseudogrignonensis]